MNRIAIPRNSEAEGFRLLPIEWATILYALFTTALLFLFWQNMHAPGFLLAERIAVLGGVAAFASLNRLLPLKSTRLLRTLFSLSLLAYWYPDTYEFCQLFPNLDHVFAHADLMLFGCQPSLAFSAAYPSCFSSELFHMGYFSYYPMIAVTCLLPFFVKGKSEESRLETYEHMSFIVMAGFYLYYVVFLFLPVAGPQFYFQAIGFDNASNGYLPALGDYFRYHTELHKSGESSGLFQWLVEFTQGAGERPTAAFPSSHVGMSTIMMILIFKQRRVVAYCFLPFYLLLCASTVYIQAHYLVDVIGGLVTAVLFYYICQKIYKKVMRQ